MTMADTVFFDPFEVPQDIGPSKPKTRATRTAFTTVRTLPSEKIRLRAAARRAGYRDVSSWARGLLLAAATGDAMPRIDIDALAEIARLRRDLNSGIGANLNQAMLHANACSKAGMAVDDAGLTSVVAATKSALEALRTDLQQALKPHGRA